VSAAPIHTPSWPACTAQQMAPAGRPLIASTRCDMLYCNATAVALKHVAARCNMLYCDATQDAATGGARCCVASEGAALLRMSAFARV
jgi:hypothetical protein